MTQSSAPTPAPWTRAPRDAAVLAGTLAGLALHGAARAAAFACAAAALVAAGSASCFAQGAASPPPAALGGAAGPVAFSVGLESPVVLRGSDGQGYLVVDLAAAPVQASPVRPGMAVALVVDRSGSMSGEKIERAREAAASFIAGLADGDVVAIFQYDGEVELVAPPTVVDPGTRRWLIGAVSTITPRGATNLYGGLVSGIAALSGPEAERPVRRVVLISDGLANVGPSSPAEIGAEASRAAASGISVTAVGVGLDYDEGLLGTLAYASGGRFYHLTHPAQMASILEAELDALAHTVARQVLIQVRPAPGVRVLDATGASMARGPGSAVSLGVGDLLAGQSRPVVLTLALPTRSGGARSAGTVTLAYRDPDGRPYSAATEVGYELTTTAAAVEAAVDPRLALAVERHRAATASLEAARLVGAGDADGASAHLAQQAERLRARADRLGGETGEALRAEASRVDREGETTRRARAPAARRARQLELNDSALDAFGL